MKIPYLPLLQLNTRFTTSIKGAVSRILTSGKYLLGEENKHFEQTYAEFIGTKYCVSTSNGLDALTLIFEALMQLKSWEKGDEVIVPAFTFIASVEAIRRVGLTPIFCDVNSQGLLDVTRVSQLFNSRTRALLAVHLYGQVCEMVELENLTKEKQIVIVEDAAQAHGASFKGRHAGEWGIAAAFSFYPGKNLGALGDAGAVTTNDKYLAERIRALANYGAEQKYEHRFAGYNMRMDELQAAILLEKLPLLKEDNEARRRIAQRYLREIQHRSVRLLSSELNRECAYHIFPIFVNERQNWQEFLRQQGIQTLIHYPLSVHQQESFKEYRNLRFPIAEKLAQTCLSIPLHPLLSMKEVSYIIQTINSYPYDT